MKNVLITGASGMIGSELLNICLNSTEVGTVTSLVRKASGTEHKKLKEVIIEDFAQYPPEAEYLTDQDLVFFCIGVYTGAVDRETFRKITVDYPVNLAMALYPHNPEAVFCLLSGSGADRKEKSNMMFAKDKGIAENKLAAIGFKRFHTFRPAYIYPVKPRKEPNFSYKLFRSLYPLYKRLGKAYSIPSTDLAQAMYTVGLQGSSLEVLENIDIHEVLKA